MNTTPNIKATLLGATGLIGGHVLKELIEDKDIASINVLVRRKVGLDHPKIKEILVDFKDDEAFNQAIEPDSTIFCAIGTTNKKVKGDKEKYRAIDFEIPLNAALFGIDKGCRTFVLVSSMGADSSSSNFYTRLKGEIEEEISTVGFDNLHIFRPSLLLGNRKEFRLGERIAQFFMTAFSFLIPARYKPIKAEKVAKAMVNASKNKIKNTKIYTYKDILSAYRF